MASVTITSHPGLLDTLSDELGRERDVRLRRLALGELEATVEDSAEFLVRMRIEAKLKKLADGDWRNVARVDG